MGNEHFSRLCVVVFGNATCPQDKYGQHTLGTMGYFTFLGLHFQGNKTLMQEAVDAREVLVKTNDDGQKVCMWNTHKQVHVCFSVYVALVTSCNTEAKVSVYRFPEVCKASV